MMIDQVGEENRLTIGEGVEAMMIDQVGEGNRLTIGEGVETTLAALQLGLSYKAANNLRPSGPTRRSTRSMTSSGVIDRSNAPASLLTPYR